jgi:very-short-patch-repair endonuclease
VRIARYRRAQLGRDGADGPKGMRWRTDAEGWDLLRPRARSIRREPTKAESKLWQRLRRDQLGVRFRTQVAIVRFVVDFYWPSRRLVVEVDGDARDARSDADAERDRNLEALGFRVLRVRNEDVLEDLEAVVQIVANALVRP